MFSSIKSQVWWKGVWRAPSNSATISKLFLVAIYFGVSSKDKNYQNPRDFPKDDDPYKHGPIMQDTSIVDELDHSLEASWMCEVC